MKKDCKKCLKILDVSNFTPSRYNKSGYGSYCRPCNNRRTREYERSPKGIVARRLTYKKYRESKKGKANQKRYEQTTHGKANRLAQVKRWQARNKHKIIAQKKARVLPEKPCQVCGAKKSEKHHPDYSKPYDVIYLCRRHHSNVHNGKIAI